MSKVYIGSINPVKLSAVKEVFHDYQVIAEKSDSYVGNQPKSDQITVQGAINRAKSLPSDGLRIGLEAGVEWFRNQWFLVNWGVLIDEEERVFYAGGTRIPIPEMIGKQLDSSNKELAELMDEYYRVENIKHKQGAIGILTNNRIKRVDIFIHIALLLRGQYESHKHNQDD